ncbi:MAG: ABC transporter substrate-binding protein [Holosporales bacterium]|jgi:ABC-type amino acid transport substrate-binding protein|nr:ABC transporter substrate-binding protein [Holosporales bacterium]
MIRFSFRSLFAALFSAVFLFFSGCGRKEPPLTVVTTGTNAPFSYEKDGELVGFDLSLVRILAEAMGREIKVKCEPLKNLLDIVSSGRADIAIGGISITGDRKGQVDFVPYHKGGFAMVAFGSSEDLKDSKNLSGKKIAVCQGSMLEGLVKSAWIEIPNVFVISVDLQKPDDIPSNLRSGMWNAFVMDADSAKHFVATHSGFTLVPLEMIEPLELGIAVPKGSHYAQLIISAMETKKEQIDKLKNEHFSAAAN